MDEYLEQSKKGAEKVTGTIKESANEEAEKVLEKEVYVDPVQTTTLKESEVGKNFNYIDDKDKLD